MMRSSSICLAVLMLAACSDPPKSSGVFVPDGAGFLTDSKIDPGDGFTKEISDSSGDIADGVTEPLKDSNFVEDTTATCTDGQIACYNEAFTKFCFEGKWAKGDECTGDATCKFGVCAKPAEGCTPGATKCDGYQYELTCAPDGNSWLTNKCPGKQQCAAGKCRDVVCTPSVNECAGVNSFHTCLPDGSAWGADSSCKSGASCLGGKCLSLCETNLKVSGNVGCEYWSVDMDSYHDTSSALFNPKGLTPDFIPHSVVIFNPGIYDAKVKFQVAATCPDGTPCQPEMACGKDGKSVCDKPNGKNIAYELAIVDPIVKAGASKEFKMPVLNAEGDTLAPKGVHITSDQPIIAWQFNPFNAEGAASNDGSLLLPQNILGKQYYAVSSSSGPVPIPFSDQAQHGYFSVVAASTGLTTVTITPACDVKGNLQFGIPPLKKGVPWTTTMLQYQVLTLQATEAILFPPTMFDLTGTFVQADKPVAVFGGHEELVLGNQDAQPVEGKDSCCAEHVEEQFMPLESWGKDVLCVKTKPRGGESDFYRVMAGEPGVTVTTTPSIKDLDGHVFAKGGDWIEVKSDQSFQLHATGKVQVVQFIVSGHQTDDGTGDPSMSIVPPISHYRMDYGILTAQGYKNNHASVVRKVGVEVLLDNAPIAASAFQTFGDGVWERAYVDFKTGQHTFESKQAFGLQVYGYGNVTAYSYPGGMTLQ